MTGYNSFKAHTGKPRPGSVRYTDAEGKKHEAAPRDPLYSTLVMTAQEYYDGERWVPMFRGHE